MALLHCTFDSQVLNFSTSMCVILPQTAVTQASSHKLQTLYLLHGMGDDHTTWLRQTALERYAAEWDVAVIMPAVQRSFYTDMAYGYRYWTFLTEELPAVVQRFFVLSTAREDTFVAGLSMGGYGAFKWALTYPERFAAAASLSGALDVVEGPPKDNGELQTELRLIFGDLDALAGTPNDLFYLAQQVAQQPEPKPRFYQCCGIDDFIYPDNRKFRAWAEALSLPLTYEEGPGAHTWAYWDQQLQRVFRWLALRPLTP